MKKIILMFILFVNLIIASSIDDISLEIKGGKAGYYKLASREYEWKSLNFFGIETYYRFTSKFEAGGGIEFSQFTFFNKEGIKRTILRAPVYINLKYYIFEKKIINPYIKGQFGYQVILESPQEGFNNGGFSAMGLGLDIKNFMIELNVSKDINTGSDEHITESVAYQVVLAYKI